MNVQATTVQDGIINTNLAIPRNPIKQLFLDHSANLNYYKSDGYFDMYGFSVNRRNITATIVEGTSIGQRIGTTIRAMMLNISISITNRESGINSPTRFVIIMAKQPYDDSNLPTWTDIFIDDDLPSAYNPDRICEQTTILYDSGQIALEPPNVGGLSKWTRDLMIPLDIANTIYKSNTGVPESLASNSIWILCKNYGNHLFTQFSLVLYYLQ